MGKDFRTAWKQTGVVHRFLLILDILIMAAMIFAAASAFVIKDDLDLEQPAALNSCTHYCLKTDAPVLAYPYEEVGVQDKLAAGSAVWPTLKRVDYWAIVEYALVEYALEGTIKTGYVLRTKVEACQ